MWGYDCAAAELGLRHVVTEFALFQGDDRLDQALIHYCYDSRSRDGTWRWSKRTYTPWEPVPPPPACTPAASVELIRLVNEYATREVARRTETP